MSANPLTGTSRLIQNVIVGELFISYIIYTTFQIIYFVKWDNKGVQQQPSGVQQKKQQGTEQQTSRKWDNDFFKKTYATIFVSHLIAIGMAAQYNSTIVSAIFAWIHLTITIVYIILFLLKKAENIHKILLGVLQVVNLILILIGLAGAGSS